ncbi:MAG TPA: hypothetical protein PLI34_12625 [Saprospiraceae bacterium]|nr:hypothetical protein [Saprospiraceae bacterium]
MNIFIRCFFCIAFGLLTTAAQAQAKYRLADYMPNHAGDSLLFQNLNPAVKEPILIAWPDTATFKGQTVLERTESTGGRRLELLDPAEGWKLFLVGFQKGTDMIFEKPLLLLPAEVEHGAVYRSSSPFSVFSSGRKLGAGIQNYEIKVQGHDTSRTPLRNFGECLVIITTSTRTDTDGVRRGYEIKEWYARDFGLVKMAGEAFTLDAKGARTRVVKAAGMLEKAKVAGESYKWND